MKRFHRFWMAPILPLIAVLASCASSPTDVVSSTRRQGCQVLDLNIVFQDPASYSGRKFCGEAIGVPQRTGITFFPIGYEYSSRFYDTAMFLNDRNVSDRLRLSQAEPFRIRLEGILHPAEECFSRKAVEGEILCTPTRRPITLMVTDAGQPYAVAAVVRATAR